MKQPISDKLFMERALLLAERGQNEVAPNPLVGCVIVSKHGEIIGKGWHKRYGGAHAEVEAFDSVKDVHCTELSESTWYVTLEPCNHAGKTPPCTDLLLRVKPRRVVIGCLDPNPIVQGGGVETLKKAGITTEVGCLEERLKWQNRRFFWNSNHRSSWIVLKWAESQDGWLDPRPKSKRIPGAGSFAITGGEARALTHAWRAQEQAILIGANTALVDHPKLTVRDANGKSPQIILFDPSSKVSHNHPLFQNNPSLIHICGKQNQLNSANLCQWDISEGFDKLSERLFVDFNISSVLVEGGAQVLELFIRHNRWNEIKFWQSSDTLEAKEGLRAPVVPASSISPPEFVERQGQAGKDHWQHWIHSSFS
ncbi:MAG: bifunctional diaminohydroxyphosphoribosylaminopyrimidine deaminase/5-amino-6-(5-phosphoribosylamino)uracil reductase RibD [Bacteroidetes bacterium]|nr:bifunctional diaminohydroxyphosphoribosylaminopyrimidine deaminase/5-amino-6-(5-phosphoribosylamino)uracil reductase RibD [Bacteroidota bacterium]MDA1336381.1 bifunctional diaminohydroxyphosphoribosylaminopyrimidine deaminase/5-amino-6-(5-phosphoribosylamino)uracil reductase RibD [Bacteroidota bacterium]